MLVQLEFNGSPYLGVFGRANDTHVLLPPNTPKATRRTLVDALEVEPVVTTMGGVNIIGSVVAMNGRGAAVADFASDVEVRALEDVGLEVVRLKGKFNAAGNNVLANDHGALVNPELGRGVRQTIADAFDVPVEAGTVAGIHTVGSAAVVTSQGALAHPKTTEEELSLLEDLFHVEAMIGTVNHGAPYIGAGLVANAHGCAMGTATTGPEMNRIEDALGYI